MNTVLPPPAELRDRAIVLVHGAWVGEWSWLPVLPLLQASGRPVYNVSLTGQGARRHEHGPHITLADHVADVVGVFDTFDLTNVTLVGHSYGGRVITGAAAQVPSRLGAIVYLDAHAPVAPDPGQPAERYESAAANGGLLPFGGYEHDVELLGSELARQWFLDRVVMHPFQTFTAPWQCPVPDGVRKTYVFATDSPGSRFGTYAHAAEADPVWAYHELPGAHFLMFTHPDEVADIILNA
jgi:pimeloyl-ACP methyl ester carboxylesterase